MADSVPPQTMSRGRDFQSSGRGGAGNIHRDGSAMRHTPDGPDDFSDTRGREPVPSAKVTTVGRGGAGNFRSPSRGRAGADSERAQEQEIIRNASEEARAAVHSTGRGGLGNISRSQSRSHSRPPQHSTGRGGTGNIKPGDAFQADILELQDDEWAAAHLPHVRLHSTGRGGAANITPEARPPVEVPAHHAHEFESSGRGGAGNMVRSRSASRGGEPEREGREKHAHGLAALLQRVGRSGSRVREEPERKPAPGEGGT